MHPLKKNVVLLAVGIISLFLIITGAKNAGLIKTKPRIFKDILLITSPIYSFSGTIKEVRGNKIVVSQPAYFMELPSLPSPQTYTPSSEENLIFTIIVSPQTIISKKSPNVQYIFRTGTPKKDLETITVESLKNQVGEQIAIVSTQDIRTLEKNELTAKEITLFSHLPQITGSVKKISSSIITLQSNIPSTKNASGFVMFEVNVNKNTEISRMEIREVEQAPEASPLPDAFIAMNPLRFSLGDIKINQTITVFADDIRASGGKITALRIEPMPITPTPAIIEPLPVTEIPPAVEAPLVEETPSTVASPSPNL